MRQRPPFGLRTGGGVDLRLDPALVEEAVFLALRAREASGEGKTTRAFLTEREALYEAAVSPEERERQFQALALRYFRAVGLEAAFADRFSELPLVASHVGAAVVRRVWSRKEEDVDLYVPPDALQASGVAGRATLLIALQASRCCDLAALVAWLRRELLRISDMVDPAFAYEPAPRLGGACETEDELIRERFRVLWSVFVETRMRRNGWAEGFEPRARQAVWDALQQRSQWTQRELLELAREHHDVQVVGW